MKKITFALILTALLSCTLVPTNLKLPYYEATPLNEPGNFNGYSLGLGVTEAHNLNAPKIRAINNKVVMVSVGASVQNQISERLEVRFTELTNPKFQFVNLCQPAKDINDWLTSPEVWTEANNRLADAEVLKEEVQIIWLQDDIISEDTAYFPEWPLMVKDSMISLVGKLRAEFPKLKQIFISGRPYTGYTADFKHTEPKGYYNGWTCRFLVEDQIAGVIPSKPWISDAIYMWTNGSNMRLDGFQVSQSDFKPDGLHLTLSGKNKFGDYLFEELKSNPVSSKYIY